jgi:hypothetical protein
MLSFFVLHELFSQLATKDYPAAKFEILIGFKHKHFTFKGKLGSGNDASLAKVCKFLKCR